MILEVGSWKLEVGSWKMEVGSWKMEDGRWKEIEGSWNLKYRKFKMEIGIANLLLKNKF